MSTNTVTLCTVLLIAGFVSACGSGNDNDNDSSIETQGPVETGSPSNDESTNDSPEEATGATEENPVESDPIETGNGQNVVSATQDTPETIVNPQNDGEQSSTDSQQEGSDNEQPIADNPRVNFGAAELLVDLVPNGDSYPTKFHLAGDKLYFWTVDTDPRFARCGTHWSNLTEAHMDVELSLVAIHPETGVVAMNKKMMKVGDFAESPNNACAGYNGQVTQVFEHIWTTPQSANGEQQFVLDFGGYGTGPDQVWMTDGSESNTRQVESGLRDERTFFEGDKVFFVTDDGLSVSDTLAGDRRKLFETDPDFFYGQIRQIARSPARQATFEMPVGPSRFQIWTYDLDTDEWEKKFNLRPDDSIYQHYATLLVDGETLVSSGADGIGGNHVLSFSSNYGDVTSFEILSGSTTSIDSSLSRSNLDSRDQLFYSVTDFSAEPFITSVVRYREERIDNLFSITIPDVAYKKVIAGYDGQIYVTGTRSVSGSTVIFELWSFNPQTEQLVKLSNDDWYALNDNHLTLDEGYLFRYLNTPDGLVFVNLTDESGRELWFTDGTPEGTRQLTDINPGSANSDPENFYRSGDAIYFSANDGTHGHEPWVISISR